MPSSLSLVLVQQELLRVVLLPGSLGFLQTSRLPGFLPPRAVRLCLLLALLLRQQRGEIPHPVRLAAGRGGGAIGTVEVDLCGGDEVVQEPLERAADDAEGLSGACGDAWEAESLGI